MSIQDDKPATVPSKVDVIIVGAGLSGLTSALKIIEKEPALQVKIIEATSSIGGQLTYTQIGEIGTKYITEDQFHIFSMFKELNIPLRRRKILSPNLERCWDIDSGVSAFLAKHELERYIEELELRSQYFIPGQSNPYITKGTMSSHINGRLHFSQAKKFMANLVLLFSGADPADISYNEFMSICWSCGGLKMLIDIYIDCPETLWEIASVRLLNELKDKLANVEILLKRKVVEIRHYRDSVELDDSENEMHKAEAVILAIPRNSIEDIKITPTMPMELRKPPPPPLERSKYVMTSFLAKYVEGHWRLAGFNGNLFLNEPIMMIGHEYRPTVYSGLMVHEEGIEPLVRQMVLSALSKHFGEEMFLPLEYVQRTFELSPMTNMPFTSPWNRLVWSSSAVAATCYRGRLSGAVQSGLRAAMNALFILRPQTVGWQDIADIQCASTLISPQTTRFSVWLSSWNIFNLSSYGLLFLGMAAAVGYLYKNYY